MCRNNMNKNQIMYYEMKCTVYEKIENFNLINKKTPQKLRLFDHILMDK